jgi:protoporphyrinogen oxidase
MPISQLLNAMNPPAAETAVAAANDLRYRDFLTVALVVPEEYSFPDNWIYVHAKEVQVGRIQNFGSWSPYLVKERRTCLGLEYFVFEGDATWNKPDAELIEQGKRELGVLGLVDPAKVEMGYVVRMPKAYPFYDEHYRANVATIVLTAANIATGTTHDVWSVNVEEEYHEERSKDDTDRIRGTGRDAPVIPRANYPAEHPINKA